ncbi:MAG: GMC family oxidoreductase N-terminal domain-containing protein [Betaproteobacteria bacterium AqS2]|uniref:GMC family oxidoreductase N-terminal domain-containing protein n=1 Tax=Candidatus Amphirhobacter heronislandensis TaxID=1732024 RepID=A0A930UBF7_9GAMM|nr:GMC family oxidoreductase N-terminal domain-containing protein [Betaproteobacteria bacterium AqS2]
MSAEQAFDYVIAGGGTAGCVLANRLSADPACRVLLLEAGGADSHYLIHMPVGFAKMTAGPYTWGYRSVPQRHGNGREILLPQARVLGGGGSINALVFTRGAPSDFDRWEAEHGCTGWSFKDVQPYFLKCEDNDRLSKPWHGVGGPLGVSDLVNPHPLTKAFVRAGQEFGLPYSGDFNGAAQEGVGVYQTTTRGGRRCSAAVAYLRPARKRPNLTVKTGCTVLRLLVANGSAGGVEYVQNGGAPQKARAEAETVVCAGAIGTPRLLMLSGLGPADELKKLGIEVAADLPGVGENLHDHCDIDIVYELRHSNSLDRYNKKHWALWAGLQYVLFNSGPVTSNVAEGAAFSFHRDRPRGPAADFQFHFLPGAGAEAGVPPVPSGYGCTLNTYQVQPRSRGTVKLRSADPKEPPLIDPNYLAEAADVEASVEALQQAVAIMGQPSLAAHVKQPHHPPKAPATAAECEAYIRANGRTSYHHCGTCRMGGSDDAPLDPQLRVRGVGRLRVADSSAMPQIISSNTNATTFMIAEKAADLIAAAS